MWTMVSDMAAVGTEYGYDVATGGFVLNGDVGPTGRRRLSACRAGTGPGSTSS